MARRRDYALPLLCAGALLAIEAALIAPGHVLAGGIADGVLLLLMLHVRLWPPEASHAPVTRSGQDAILALAMIPLSRVLALGLPLRDGSQAAAALVIAVLIGGSALILAPSLALLPRLLFSVRSRRTQLGTGLAGLALGFVAYLAGAPALSSTATGGRLLAICAAGATGIAEEVVFRGIVQMTLVRVVGRAGALAAAALFAATYLSAGSVALVLTITVAGLVFAASVARCGTLSGAIVGHVLLAVGAGVIWPVLLGKHAHWVPHGVITVLVGCATAGMVGVVMILHPRTPARGSATRPGTGTPPADGAAAGIDSVLP
jgi:membrane protease YdiL (CAAX protease family)